MKFKGTFPNKNTTPFEGFVTDHTEIR